MAETSGLLNRRRGNSLTEGSNPSVSASLVADRILSCGLQANGLALIVNLALTQTLRSRFNPFRYRSVRF